MPFTSYFFKPLPCVCCYLRKYCCDRISVLFFDSANTHRASPASGASTAGLQIYRDGLPPGGGYGGCSAKGVWTELRRR